MIFALAVAIISFLVNGLFVVLFVPKASGNVFLVVVVVATGGEVGRLLIRWNLGRFGLFRLGGGEKSLNLLLNLFLDVVAVVATFGLEVVVKVAVLRWSSSISSLIASRMSSIGPGVRSVVVAGPGGGIVLAIPTSKKGSAVDIKFWGDFFYQ